MSTGAKAGRLQRLYIDDSGGPAYQIIEELLDASCNLSRDLLEATNKGGETPNNARDYIAGRESCTVSGSFQRVEGNAGQVEMQAAWSAGTKKKFKWQMDADAGADLFEADCFVTAYTLGAPVDGISTVDFTLQATGAVTITVA